MRTYVGIVHKGKKTDYGVCFPDFPGCISAGKTPEELQYMAQEALRFHIEMIHEDGETIPEPMSLEKAKKHEFAEDANAFLFVSALVPSKPVRVNVMLDKNLLARIDRVAPNRSAFLAKAAMDALAARHHPPR